jgi:Glycosyl hydrolases family 2, sugar binding domain/Glycosyl hydrolases family 2
MSPLILTVILCSATASAAERTEVSLNGDWDFTWTPTSTETIPALPPAEAFDAHATVPMPWDDQLDRFKDASWWNDAVFTSTIGPVRYLTGIGWYKRTIDIPTEWQGRAALLNVGWAVGQMHVWVNGQHAGSYDHGVYTPLEVDVTAFLVPGRPSVIVISVDNTRGFTGGWAFIGNAGKASGITRPVTLTVSPSAARITDIYVRPGDTLKDVAWTVELADSEQSGALPSSTLAWEVMDAADTVLGHGEVDVPASGRLSWQTRVDGVKPWSPKQPNLYWTTLRWTAKDGTVLDICTQRFGLRRWSHEGRKLFLNGKPMYLRGDFGAYYYPVHCSTPTSKDHWIKYVTRAKAIGMNYVNFAARVCPIELMEAADELGIILQCGDHMTVLQQHREACEEVWEPIVRLTRKYPSMSFYGFGGERDYYDGIIDQYQRQYDLIKTLHPECMVMPQQAIRGIDYAFDEKGKQELTKEPFPHHAERLAQYTKACDLFGHYSGGAFGYNYFGDPWREMEKRFLIYDKPLSMHELFMGMSYLNPDNAAKYTGRVPPYLYTKLRADLIEAGLLERWENYNDASARLQAVCQKYCVEKTRKCNELAGFEYLGMTDMHFCEHYTVGILDEFMQLKPGDTEEGILRYNAESVLLLDFGEDSINRSYWSGDPFKGQVMVSLFGDEPITGGTVSWALNDGHNAVLNGSFASGAVPNGAVTTLGELSLTWPSVSRTTRLNLSVQLAAPGYDLANDWDFWVFPRNAPPKVSAAANETTYGLLSERYSAISKLTEDSQEKLHIVSALNEKEVEHLANGGDVLLLGTAPFLEYASWRSFRPGLGAREHHNVGSVVSEHPIFTGLPHEGWGDWQFFPILEGATCLYFEDELNTPFDPLLEVISSAEHVRKHAAILEKRVGKGRLLISTAVHNRPYETSGYNPSCVALTDGILSYMTSDGFDPATSIDPEILARLMAPVDPGDPRNLVSVPGFEERDMLLHEAWLPYGAAFEIDTANAHSGDKSLKLYIPPAVLKNNPKHYTGTKAKVIRFKRTPTRLKLSAWHKAEAVTETSANNLLIFIYIAFADGGRHTLRLHFDDGTHDWQLAETTWAPGKDIASATLYIGLAHSSGTAWVDDIYFGPALPAEEKTDDASHVAWIKEPVTVTFEQAGQYRLNEGSWQSGREVRVTQEGVTAVSFKKDADGEATEVQKVRIDTTPPTIVLSTQPPLEQQGGIYSTTTDTAFSFQAEDALSGVASIEVAIDDGDYRPCDKLFKLAVGKHRLRCRATDKAGNSAETITGAVLTGGETRVVEVEVE